jgi:hypothetical protein
VQEVAICYNGCFLIQGKHAIDDLTVALPTAQTVAALAAAAVLAGMVAVQQQAAATS